ncbi:MAG: 50S ribosomal protein L24 [Gemmatimonadales bacterium]
MKPLVYRKARRVRHAPPVRQKLHVTKGDTVQVISGDEKGRRGRVLRVLPKSGRVVIEGINLVKRHRRATTPGGESGIITMAAPVHHSKVMLVDPKSGEPTRIRRQKDKDGTVERIAVKSGQPIPRSR